MKDNQYWINRSKERMMQYHNDSDETINIITKSYDKAMDDIEKDIKVIFNNYAINEKLTPSQARRYLNQKIPNFIFKLIKELYPKVKNERIKSWMKTKINSHSYKARITRLEALRESMHIRSKQIADAELNLSNTQHIKTIKNAYYKNIFDVHKGIGVGFSFNAINEGVIQEILKNKWSGRHFSERIWGNTDILAEQLAEIVTTGFMTGKSIDKMSRELRELTNTGKYVATRLIRTETTYMANAAEIESYKECGIEKYIFVATLDLRTSEGCRRLDREVFEVSKAVPGENIPPMHPNCRSTTRSYVSKEELAKVKRRARDPITGRTYLVPADMSYKDWFERYVKA